MEMDIVQDLKLSKSLVLQHFDLPATALLWSYGEGKWNIRQLLIHIVDAETVLYDRIRRIISEQPNPLIWAFDQDAWAAHLDYHTFPLEISNKYSPECGRASYTLQKDTTYPMVICPSCIVRPGSERCAMKWIKSPGIAGVIWHRLKWLWGEAFNNWSLGTILHER